MTKEIKQKIIESLIIRNKTIMKNFYYNNPYMRDLANENTLKSLKIEDNDHISKQQYWFVEMGDPAKYKKDLAAYFGFLDKDGDGYVSAAEYLKTFEGQYPPDAGEKYLKIMDIDMDNRLSKSEYINFDFTTLPSDSHELFHNLDANHDSFITFDEFKSSLELSW